MFDDKTKQSVNKNTSSQLPGDDGRDINLLPEKLRIEKKVGTSAGATDDIKYTQPTEVAGESKTYGTGIWSWLKNLPSRLRGQAIKPLKLDKSLSKSEVVSPATPLQRLYAESAQPKPALSAKTEGNLNVPKPSPKATVSQQATVSQPISPSSIQPKEKPVTDTPVVPTPRSIADKPVPTSKPMSMLEKIDKQLQKGIHIKKEKSVGDGQFGVNLIPEELVVEVDHKRIGTVLGVTAVLSILFIGLAYLVVDLIQLREAKQVNILQGDIQVAREEFIKKSKDLTALVAYQNLYDNIKTLLSKHLYWTQIFDFFEENVTKRVYFEDITADKNGLASVNLIAEDYMALAEQYLVFKQSPEVLNIEINSASLDAEGGFVDLAEIESFIDEIETVGSTSTNITSTTSTTINPQLLIVDAYQKLPVKAQMLLQLDSQIFYKSSTTTAKITK